MKQYRNLAGDSGVVDYEIGLDFIRVQFTGGENGHERLRGEE